MPSPTDAQPLRITYPPELPVSAARDELARAIAQHQVVVVAGATGSGKTTQLPKICLELGRERIAHTQPRRIAARSIAERIAEELGVELGGVVGYQVRFDDRSARDTRVKLMTDGVLLAEINRDRELRRYDTIILDEAHERSLTIDFLLGYLREMLPRRPDLKVIVTSATIDPESFAAHFADASGVPAPIVEVSGRTYPVEIRYRPLVAEATEDEEGEASDDRDVQQGILDALAELQRETPGDVLVFLSGEQEIRDAADAVSGRFPELEVLPLYGRLSAADQHRVFSRSTRPRVVLATNVAETSLTVPGIRYVVDAGTARISRYSPRAKVQRLPIEAISRASADQRAGRAGRTAPGIAIRLYAEEDFERRPEFTDAEILRTNLAAVILQMISLGLGDIASFPFLTPPDPRGIQDGLDLLLELGAVSGSSAAPTTRPAGPRITGVGRELARLPVDVRFGRMLVEAKKAGVAREVAAIVAGLSIQDVRERPLEKRAQADQAHARFADPTSDFLGLLRLWDHLEEQRRALSGSAFRRMCKNEFLNYLRVREWQDLYRQILSQGGLTAGPPRVDPDAIHRALLSGLLSRIGLRDERAKAKDRRTATEYLGSRQQRFAIFPGSSLAKKPPAAVMAAELVETSRLFARTVAAIDPAWAEPLAGELVKRSYSEPRWEKRQGSAVADERVTLFGVPIVPRRRIQLARIDPEQARELLIRHALVGGEWPYDVTRNGLYGFDRENRALRRELGELEERARRRDILSGDEALVGFYDARIPADVTDVRRFERWWKDARRETPALLAMTRADLLEDEPDDAEAFPDELGGFRLDYRFEPGAVDDGITVEIPLAQLPAASPAGYDRLVPALREELVSALLRTLPKALRRELVPAGDWARRMLPELPDDPSVPLTRAIADAARRLAHVVIRPEDFDVERLPAHLRMGFAAVDERGRRVGTSKDLGELQARLAERTRSSVARAVAPPRSAIERDRVDAWDLGDLPTELQNGAVRGYPALVDEGDHVALRVLANAGEQLVAHRRGVRRLIALTLPSPAAYIQDHLTTTEKLQLATSPYRSVAALIEDAVLAVVDDLAGERAPFDAAGFAALRQEVSAALIDRSFAVVSLAARALAAAREADKTISASSSLALMGPLADARAQLDALIHPGFLRITGAAQLPRVPVYLAGIVHRVERMPENLGRDRAWQTEVEQAVALYRDAGGPLPLRFDIPERLVAVRWMLEELRLSLFAQPLGARGPVSVQRVRKALAG
ncbi:ATP-dependent RNA helicase HrpA [Pseudolysinimonas sp.]|uniref:ATP-dependent RNA helicase HrpA n=1 Tax=Pseudolysinimonas sp. TaxID=2680009 RepID=UPI003F81E8F8